MAKPSYERRMLPRKIDWSAAIVAGVIAGAGFAGLEMLLNVLLLRGLLPQQVRMTAAIVLGDGVLAPDVAFDLRLLLIALAVHFALSIVFAIVLAALILRLQVGAAELIGLAFGLLLYVVNFYVLVGIFPWFREERNWVSIVCHLLFGVLAALLYKAFASRAEELGLE
ncbi:MAG TPA: hypothetical protein VMN39_11080 [Longimicrobiaceae bacterium]|nr:hypothetical protein [Longimicrobiaceae bacterium]